MSTVEIVQDVLHDIVSLSRRRRTYVQELARYLGSQKIMCPVHDAHGAAWGNQQSMLQHRFFIFDLCDDIG